MLCSSSVRHGVFLIIKKVFGHLNFFLFVQLFILKRMGFQPNFIYSFELEYILSYTVHFYDYNFHLVIFIVYKNVLIRKIGLSSINN